jgi:hypothetical protein
MTTQFVAPVNPPEQGLEGALVDDFFRLHGLVPNEVRRRTDHAALELRKEAVAYAAMKLTEIEARAHYVHDVHGVGLE